MEVAIEKEARVFSVAQIEPKKVEALAQRFFSTVMKNRRWKQLDYSVVEARKVIERKLRAKQFIEFKKDTTIVPVTETEAREYFDSHQVRFGSLTYEKMRKNIKRYLSSQKRNRRLQEWFEHLRRKYRIRNLLEERVSEKRR